MGWWDQHTDIYEQGGITGGGSFGAAFGDQYASSPAAPAPAAAPAFDPYAQVGHDGTINGMNREQYRDAWQSSGVNSVQGAKDWIAQHGGQWLADNGTVRTPFGEVLDMGINARGSLAGNGPLRAGWGGTGGDAGGSAGGGGGAFGAAMGAGGSGGFFSSSPGGGGGGYAGYGRALPAEFQWQAFDPNSVDVTKDPGYAFRMAEDRKAQQNTAAAQGKLFTGEFMKALQDRSQGLASQEYGNAFNRALGTNQANNQGGLSAYNANVNAALGGANVDVANRGVDVQNRNVDLGYYRAGNDFTLGQGQLALGHKQADNSFALGNGQLGLGWANYGLNANQQNFNQGYSLAGLGLQAGSMLNGAGAQYGAQGGGYLTGAGNAGAAGSIGGANAWNTALGGAANAGLGAYYANHYGGGYGF